MPCGWSPPAWCRRVIVVGAGGFGREPKALAVVTASRRNDTRHAGLFLFQALHVIQTAAHLEGAGGGVVFMLDPDLGARRGREARPVILRRGRHLPMHQIGRCCQFLDREPHPLLSSIIHCVAP